MYSVLNMEVVAMPTPRWKLLGGKGPVEEFHDRLADASREAEEVEPHEHRPGIWCPACQKFAE